MKRIISFLAAALVALTAFAQNSITVQAPNLVAVDEQFNVTFIISGENAPSDFSWNPGSDFQLVWGPQKGTSTSISIINGSRSKTSQTSYTYVLLPKSTGKFQLASAQAVVKGNQITSNRPTIEVVSDGASANRQSGGSQQSQGGNVAQTGSVSSDDIFLRLSFSKKSAMVGETITATMKLYQRVNITGFEDAKFPSFNGFWSQETTPAGNIQFHRENLGDKIYNAAVIRSWTLVPQQAGDIKIDGAELVCLVSVRAPRASTGSILDDFFQDDYQTIRKRVTTAPTTFHISALPAGAPDSFGGGVGSFSMNASLTKDALNAHDAASLKVTVTGTGNVALLEAPKINFPPDFEVYDVKTSDVSGGKTFEYPFIPRSAGDFTIGPVEYSYYDVNQHKYVTLNSAPMPISVAKGDGNETEAAGQLVQSGVNRKDVNNLGSDIRFISTKTPAFAAMGTFFVGSTAFWVIAVLLILAAAAVWFALRTVAARRADVAGSKNRGANKMARKRLAQAGDFLGKNLYTAFYEELHKALLGYVSDKLNMDATDLSKENIAARLQENGVSEALASEFTGLLDACEFARYSPDAGHEAMNDHYEKAVSVISAIEDSMRKPHKPSSGAAAAAVLALLILSPLNIKASDGAYADSLWTAGVNAYSNGSWNEAAKAWNSVRDLGVESPQLYYNLGNACFKGNDISHAILNYERALRLNPSYSDARFNLEFAQTMVQDKIEAVPEFFLTTFFRKVCWLLSSNAWAVLGLVLLAVALAMLLVFLLGRSEKARKTGFISGIVALVLTALCIWCAFSQRSDYRDADGAVVTRPVASVKSSPDNSSAKDLFILHEGTEVKLLDTIGEWRNIELSDGRQGWMMASDLEVI